VPVSIGDAITGQAARSLCARAVRLPATSAAAHANRAPSRSYAQAAHRMCRRTFVHWSVQVIWRHIDVTT